MLKKTERLTSTAFDTFFKSGKRHHSPNLQLIHAKNEGFHGAAVVGKKVFKKAVARNQMRRRLYGVLYRIHQSNNLSGVIMIIAKPSAKNLTHQQLLTEAKDLITQLK